MGGVGAWGGLHTTLRHRGRTYINHEAADAVPHMLIKTLIKWWHDGGLNVAANFTLGLALISSNLAARRRIYRTAFAPPNRT